ncbi:MAG: hypothetical protein JWR84_3568 [Caulobacter sp.]|nr:hypothetical protein [Caulobacter sp.]
MIRTLTTCAGVGLLIAALPCAVMAADSPWTVKAAVASEFISKGAGKSGGEPAVQAEAAYDFGPVTAGVWGSTARTSQGGDAELQAFVGGAPKVGAVKLDLRAIVKTIPGTESRFQDTWLEVRADAATPVAGTDLRLRVEYSPDSYAATEAAWWVEAQASRKVAKGWKISAAYGLREQDGGADYRAWNAGVSWNATKRLALDLRWYDTDSHERGANYDGRLFASATVAF